jgi:hypothetical protein
MGFAEVSPRPLVNFSAQEAHHYVSHIFQNLSALGVMGALMVDSEAALILNRI